MPSVLWHCWLGGRNGIQPVKVVGCWVLAWLSVSSEVQTCTRPSWCHCHSLSLASVKSRLVLPFWYRLTRVVPEKGPLNECVFHFVWHKILWHFYGPPSIYINSNWRVGMGLQWRQLSLLVITMESTFLHPPPTDSRVKPVSVFKLALISRQFKVPQIKLPQEYW